MRVQLRPAGRTAGVPSSASPSSRPRGRSTAGATRGRLAGAALVRDFGDVGHASRPPVAVQRAARGGAPAPRSSEYLFVDEWDVAAPPDVCLRGARRRSQLPGLVAAGLPGRRGGGPARGRHALAPALQGPPAPTTCTPSSRVVALRAAARARGRRRRRSSRSRPLDADRGPTWHARALRLARARRPSRCCALLTPLLRPAFRWNHDWAIARAQEGLEPYAQGLAPAPPVQPAHGERRRPQLSIAPRRERSQQPG